MIRIRKWATPLTIGAFVLMSITGVVMFFDWEPGLTTVIHQWFSWLFLLGAGAHVLVNWRPLKNHLRAAWGRASLAVFALVALVSFHHWGTVTGPLIERPVEEALVDAPLSALAAVTRVAPEELLLRFDAGGYAATSATTIRELVERHGVDENVLLGLVFLPPRD